MEDPFINRAVVKFTRPNGDEVFSNVHNILVAMDKVVFLGELNASDTGHHLAIDPQRSIRLAGLEGLHVSEVHPMAVKRNLDSPSGTDKELLVRFEFSGPRAFEVFVDPGTLQTIVCDVTGKEPDQEGSG